MWTGLSPSFNLRDNPAQVSSGSHFLGDAIIKLTIEIDHHTCMYGAWISGFMKLRNLKYSTAFNSADL